MLIENTELFKEWLTKQLEPICDADPMALAKYVVALVKKDKPEQELATNCNDQLDVFLQDKTETFVADLFSMLKTKEYLYDTDAKPGTIVDTAESGERHDHSQVRPTHTEEPLPQQQENQPTKDAFEKDRKRKPSLERDDAIRDTRRRSPLRERRSPPRRSMAERLGPRRDDRAVRGRRFGDDRGPVARRGGGPAYYDRERFPHQRGRFQQHDDRVLRDQRDRFDDPRDPRDFYDLRERFDDRDPRERREPYRRRSRSPGRLRTPPKRARTSSPINLSPKNGQSPKKESESQPSTEAKTEVKPEQRSPRARSPVRPLFGLRSRSPQRSRSRGRPRSASAKRSRSRSWSRSRTRSRSRSRSRSFPRRRSLSRGSPKRRSRERFPLGSGRQRCRDFEEKGYCMQGDFCPYDHGLDPVVVEDINLPLPYPGQAPPNMHPPPPGGLSGPPQIPCIGPPPPGMVPTGPPPQVPSMARGLPHPHPHDMRFPPPQLPHMQLRPTADTPYNPEAPSMGPPGAPPPFWLQQQQPGSTSVPSSMGPSFSGPPPVHSAIRRDLVSVPTVSSVGAPMSGDQRHVIATSRPPPQFVNTSNYNSGGTGRGRGRGGYHQARSMAARQDYSNATLEIRKVPVELNSITKLNEHFAKFGTLTNVQIAFDGDREAALVSFSTNKEASDAYRSSEPVFNNRFIKLFWHNKEEKSSSTADPKPAAPAPAPRPEIPPPEKLSLNNAVKRHEEKERVVVNAMKDGQIMKTLYNTQVIKNKMAAIAANRAMEPNKKKEDAQKKKQEIHKQKQELLQKLMQEQKGLLDRMDKNKSTMTADDKATLVKTIKSLATHIEAIQKEVVAFNSALQNNPPIRTKQDAQKMILDAELELIGKEGIQSQETAQLRKRLADLRREAANLGLMSARGRGRGAGPGRGGFAGRGARGRGRYSLVVDRRPRCIQVTGFEDQDKDDIIKHFAYYGELESADSTTDTEMVVTFKNRQDAEQAYRSASKFRQILLTLSWYKPPQTTVGEQNKDDDADRIKKELTAAEAESASDEDDEDDEAAGLDEESLLDEDLLLGGDDLEEEEDSIEDNRAWRR